MDTRIPSFSKNPGYAINRKKRHASILCMKPILIFLTLVLLSGHSVVSGQGVGISEVSITPDNSSILELRSTERGFLAPRMSTLQRNNIGTPATGLIVYNTDTDKLNIYDGSSWRILFSGTNGVNSVTGTADRITVTGTEDLVVDIAANYTGQSSITTLGTITNGTWNADVVGVPYGGTGLANIASNYLVYGNGTGPVNTLAPSAATGALLMNTLNGPPSWVTLNTLPSSAGVLPIANGGTNSGAALNNNRIMISSGGNGQYTGKKVTY